MEHTKKIGHRCCICKKKKTATSATQTYKLTLEVSFVKKTDPQARLRKTVKSIIEISNLEFDLAEVVNVPIVASSSENEIMNHIIKNLQVDNDKNHMKR